MSSSDASSSSSSFSLDTCGDSCGWIAAILAALCYGSFGVPIKWTKQLHLVVNSNQTTSSSDGSGDGSDGSDDPGVVVAAAVMVVVNDDNDIHPLVLQSYKTFTMFLMSWLVLFLPNVSNWRVDYTHWGLLSGMLWVLGGTGGVYAIRMAGLAVAVGTWASVMICVNFVWGILIFQEPVANIPATLGAFVLLACGLVGMSYYSSIGDSNEDSSTSISTTRTRTTTTTTPAAAVVVRSYDATKEVDDSRSSSNNIPNNSVDGRSSDEAMENIPQYRLMSTSATAFPPEEEQPDDMDTMIAIRLWPLFLEDELRPVPVVVYHVSQRTAGICGAVFNGIMTGSSLIPLHYAKQSGQNAGGAHYMISLAIGALLSNLALWLVLYFVQVVKVCCSSKKSRSSNCSTPLRPRDDSSRQNDDGLLRQRLPTSGTTTTTTTLTVDAAEESSSLSSQQSLWAALDSRKSSKSCCSLWQDAYHNMPRWYFRQLYAPGICAGILLALSMFGSIIAVTQLGQGIGNSVVQCKIIISGLWGIFYFAEIRGNMTIFLWFASAALSVSGIVWLSQERLYATSNGSH